MVKLRVDFKVNNFLTKITKAMFLVSMESYDKGILENKWFENMSWNPNREVFVQNKVELSFDFECQYLLNKHCYDYDFGVYGKLWWRAFRK